MGDLNYNIKHEHDHYSVYIEGQFYCSADTLVEAATDVEKYIEERCCYEFV